jgi:hypothetical protein
MVRGGVGRLIYFDRSLKDDFPNPSRHHPLNPVVLRVRDIQRIKRSKIYKCGEGWNLYGDTETPRRDGRYLSFFILRQVAFEPTSPSFTVPPRIQNICRPNWSKSYISIVLIV